MTENAPVGLPESPADFDILDWINTGTVARRTVVVYNKPDLISELARVDAELDEAGWTDETGVKPKDGPLSDAPVPVDVDALLARRTEIEDALVASRSEWTVRALGTDEVDSTYTSLPEPVAPPQVPGSAPQVQRDAWSHRLQTYQMKKAQADADRKLMHLAIAVESIETPRGVAHGITVEQLKALRARPHGKTTIDLLYKALNEATGADVEIPRPTSPRPHTTDLG